MSESRSLVRPKSGAAWHAEAQALRGQGWDYAEIALRLGRSKSAVWKATNRERISESRRLDNARRREAKAAWDRSEAGREVNKRSADRHRAACEGCGAAMHAGSQWRDAQLCRDCGDARRRERHKRTLAAVERMYNDGLPLAEIADALGRSRAESVCGELRELRLLGRIGYRHPFYARAA